MSSASAVGSCNLDQQTGSVRQAQWWFSTGQVDSTLRAQQRSHVETDFADFAKRGAYTRTAAECSEGLPVVCAAEASGQPMRQGRGPRLLLRRVTALQLAVLHITNTCCCCWPLRC